MTIDGKPQKAYGKACRQTDGTWVETAQLLPPESDTFGMGWAVQLEGDRAVVGAPGASIGSTNGKVFVYERVAGVWTKKNTLKPTIALGRDSFGAALDLEGDRVAIGASYMFGNEEGLAFVFKRNPLGTQWSQEAVFSPSDLSDWDSFGKDVAFDGDTVLVSAPLHDLVGWNAGAVYEFKLGETGWSLTDKFWSDDLV